MSKNAQKQNNRTRRKGRIRSKVSGTAERPRLAVFRSNTAFYAQLIDDTKGVTLASVVSKKAGTNSTSKEIAAAAKELAKAAKDKNISAVVFDRGGFSYLGNVKLFADTAREEGLKF